VRKIIDTTALGNYLSKYPPAKPGALLMRQLAGRKDKAAFEIQWLDIWSDYGNPLKPYTHPQ